MDLSAEFDFYEKEDLYEEVAQVYTLVVERDSKKAAAELRRIQAAAGARPAMRAALIMMVLKHEVEQTHALPNLEGYLYLLREYPEAIVALKQAILACRPAWGLAEVKAVKPRRPTSKP
jgi:hypothetical protein